MVLDIKRAFLYGDIERDVYIELPPEDPKSGGNIVGRLLRTMYGTRDAPQGFQKFMHRILGRLGFFPECHFSLRVPAQGERCVYSRPCG